MISLKRKKWHYLFLQNQNCKDVKERKKSIISSYPFFREEEKKRKKSKIAKLIDESNKKISEWLNQNN